MKRRTLLGLLAASPLYSLSLPVFAAVDIPPVTNSLDDWRRLLPPDRFRILFEEATEPRHSSALNKEERDGTFICAACYWPLFASDAKYESGTGWPSFTHPIEGHIGTKRDFKLFLPRTEYHCIRCGGHQGHVFKDGPQPRGERWCNNGLALQFVPAGSPMPELRG
ncbi:MAG: peptide-methionine (R)-S-oxide reductase MsrB [Halioglobus sp.]|jgi:peptide-methionine (R)-S-oxide reductase